MKWFRASIGRQVAVVVGFVVAGVMLVIGRGEIEKEQAFLLDCMSQRGELLVRSTAALVPNPMVMGDTEALTDAAEGLVEQDSQVFYTQIIRERDGKQLAQAGEWPPELDLALVREFKADILADDGSEWVTVGEVTAYVSIADTMARISAGRRALIVRSIVFFALLSLVLSLLLQRLLNRPLAVLTAHADRIGRGTLDVEINLARHDEFGVLGRSMDSMRASLERSTEEAKVQHEKLKELDRAKSSFLSTMSHEVRTPMNGVLGYTKLLRQSSLNDDQLEMLDIVASSGRALLTIINGVLDLSKIEAGEMELENIAFDLRGVMTEVVSLMRQTAMGKGLGLHLEIDPAVPSTVLGDSLRIRQIVTNLLGNALKFTKEGEVQLRLTLREQADDELDLLFEVEDSGVGIPAGAEQRLFDRFSQADTSTTREFGGTGLGLAISRHLVELMGGEIGVTSRKPHGSRFFFNAKLKKADDLVNEDFGGLEKPHIIVLRRPDQAGDDTYRILNAWGIESLGCSSKSEAMAAAEAILTSGNRVRFVVSSQEILQDDPSLLPALHRVITNSSSASHSLRVIAILPEHADAAATIETLAADPTWVAGTLCHPVLPSDLFEMVCELAPEIRTEPAERGLVDESPKPTLDHKAVEANQQALLDGSGSTEEKMKPYVLLVEDNPVNQKLARRVLERSGFDVEVAGDGSVAVDLLQSRDESMRRFDVVLMDCQMPKMDGYTATRAIRELPGYCSGLPVVALTAHAMKGDRQRCLEAGMNDYVSKPFNFAELRRIVTGWVGQRVVVPPAAAAVGSPDVASAVETASPQDVS